MQKLFSWPVAHLLLTNALRHADNEHTYCILYSKTSLQLEIAINFQRQNSVLFVLQNVVSFKITAERIFPTFTVSKQQYRSPHNPLLQRFAATQIQCEPHQECIATAFVMIWFTRHGKGVVGTAKWRTLVRDVRTDKCVWIWNLYDIDKLCVHCRFCT